MTQPPHIFSTYIIKFIIKILCDHINYNFKLINYCDETEDYNQIQYETKQLTLNLVLVSKLWFNIITSNLTVSVDFNYKSSTHQQNEYSIIKIENIKTLKIHYDHDTDSIIKINQEKTEAKEELNLVNEKIKELSIYNNNENENENEENSSCGNNNNKFKKLIFINLNYGLDYCHSTGFLNKLYKCKATKNINLLQYQINIYDRLQDIIEDYEIIKKVSRFVINGCVDKSIIHQVFKQWYKYITHFLIYKLKIDIDEPSSYQLFESILDSSGSGILPNLNHLIIGEYNRNELKDLNLILSNNATPKLENFSIDLCFNNLNYYLSTPKERIENSITKSCPCNNLFKATTGDDGHDDDIEFKKHWNQFKELIKNKSNLTQLGISNHCCNKIIDYDDDESSEKRYSNSFINELVELGCSIPKLSRLYLIGPNAHRIAFEILNLDSTTNQKIDYIYILPKELHIKDDDHQLASNEFIKSKLSISDDCLQKFESLFNQKYYIKNLILEFYFNFQKITLLNLNKK